jgi:hypothetical protein
MNETNDPLEEELAAFHPRGLSPEFRRRIAGHLADHAPWTSRWLWGIALAGGLAAACLVGFLFGQGGGKDVDSRRAAVAPPPVAPEQVDDALPTLRAYRHIVSRSPEELDAVLDKQAARAPRPDPRLGHISAFTRSDLE